MTFLKQSRTALDNINIIVRHSNNRHVSANHVDILRMVEPRIQLQLVRRNHSTRKSHTVLY